MSHRGYIVCTCNMERRLNPVVEVSWSETLNLRLLLELSQQRVNETCILK